MKIPAFIAVWRLPAPRLLRGAAVLTLLGLGFMVWSMLDPRVLPVMLAMTLGQILGTFAFLLYGIAVLQDVLRIRRERREEKP
jgi:hypothetical protein